MQVERSQPNLVLHHEEFPDLIICMKHKIKFATCHAGEQAAGHFTNKPEMT